MDTYIVKTVIDETPDVKSIVFVGEDGGHPSFEPGQYVSVLFPDLGVPEGKAYSLSSIPSDPFMMITVKAIGPYSNRICSLKPGDFFQVSQPYGFLYSEEQSPLVCMAGGVGISPLWSIIRSSLIVNPLREIHLFYSNKTKEDIIFNDEIAKLKKQNPAINVTHHITRQGIRQDKTYKLGRVDVSAVVQKIIPQDSFFVLCGTVSYVTDTYKQLRANEIQDSFISTETFFET